MKKFTVRFNLQNGDYKEWWEITNTVTGERYYSNPIDESLIMTDCHLYNNKAASRVIFNGGDKNRSAWIDCATVEHVPVITDKYPAVDHLRYNPKVMWYWQDHTDADIDGLTVDTICTVRSRTYRQS